MYTHEETIILAKLALEDQHLTAQVGSLKACREIAAKYGWSLSFAEERLDDADDVWCAETKSMTPTEKQAYKTALKG